MPQPDTDTTTYVGERTNGEPDQLRAWANRDIHDELDQEDIDKLGMTCRRGYDVDKESVAAWMDELDEIRKLAHQDGGEAKTYPWADASNVKYPLITQAALEFNARAYPTLINDGNIVKASIEGEDEDGEKASRKDRVTKYMSYQVMEKMPDWETDMDKLLMAVPTDGLGFKKVYFDPMTGENVSEFVSATNLIVNMQTKELVSCPRISHVLAYYPYEIDELQAVGLWLKEDIQMSDPDLQEPETFIEQHVLYDLDGDGYAEPYIVTFQEDSGVVVRVRANYRQEDILTNEEGKVVKVRARQYFIKYECFPNPEGGFYGWGLGQLLKSINDSVNSILNLMIDAGHLSNTGGGFLGQGFNFRSGATRFSPGEWKKVNVTGGFP